MDNEDYEYDEAAEAAGQDNQKFEQDIEAKLDWFIRKLKEDIQRDPFEYAVKFTHSRAQSFQDPMKFAEFVKIVLELLQNPVFMDETYKTIRKDFRERAVKMGEMIKEKQDVMEKMFENLSFGMKDKMDE